MIVWAAIHGNLSPFIIRAEETTSQSNIIRIHVVMISKKIPSLKGGVCVGGEDLSRTSGVH